MVEPASTPKKCKSFSVGEVTPTGATVKEILIASDKCFLYIDEADDLGCEFEETTCVDGDLSIREATDLYGQMKASAVNRERATQLIAAALSHALEDRRAGDGRDFFVDPKELLTTTRLEQFQATYLATSFIAAIVLFLAALLPTLLGQTKMDDVLRAGAFGAAGALLSVLLRFRQLVVSRYSSKKSVVIEGVVRVVLGVAFGVLFLILQKGELLMTIASSNAYATACLAAVAGFSERLVPSLIESLEGQVGLRKVV
jgi:hypothetical protein